ncbi:hypothetical protein F2P45_15805 [Massilia sp. CCM 8733]|uniref:Uncharacterized protein n=1 Tax=Massilia mucilaginosa TaxID=2609282 RepID=A0ABX0NUE8_9BURK|nr:hypothetical protein [Massilia mucilaginosa]NHZ90472.1 hypothetical protein [Massilia mucilaginosa]
MLKQLRAPQVFYPLLLIVECLYMWALSSKLVLASLSSDYVLAVFYWLVQALCLAALANVMSIRAKKGNLRKKCLFALTVYLSSLYVALEALASDDRFLLSFEAELIVSGVSFPDYPVRTMFFLALVLITFASLSSAGQQDEAPS